MSKFPNTFKNLVCIFSIALIGCSFGCQTAGFKKPSLGGLAFWKKSSVDSKLPPPPARHFDPAPLGDSQEALVDNANESFNRMDLNKDELARRIQGEIDKTKMELANARNELNNKPIRKPYSLDGSNDNQPLNANSFAKAISEPANEFKAASGNKLSDAQKQFQASVSNVNDQLQDVKKSVEQKASPWKDFELPTELANAKNSVDRSLQSVNKSLYDASGKLNSAAANNKSASPTSAFADASNTLKNSIQSRKQEITSDFNKASNEFMASTTKTLSSISPLKSAQDSIALTGNNSFDGATNKLASAIENVKQETVEAKNAIQNRVAQTISPREQGFAIRSKPNTNGNSIASPLTPQMESSQANPEMDKMRAEMDAARRQIEQLQQQVNEAKNLANAKQLTPINNQPTEKLVSQLKVPRFNSTYQPRQSTLPKSNPPVNRLRNAAPARSAYSQPQQPKTSQMLEMGSTQNNGFPTTGRGGFENVTNSAAPQQPQQPLNTATKLEATFENDSFGAPATKASMEVEIPASVLKGSGSYAPGSVHRLLSDQ